MKHVKLLAVMIVLCTIILTGCARTPDLVGTWRDSSGYTVEFREDGSYWESTYGASMRYTYDNDGLLYYWPDGYPRYAEVSFEKNQLVLQINGKTRKFSSIDKSMVVPTTAVDQISSTANLSGKFKLLGNTGVSSELYLTADKLYSLTYAVGAAAPMNWTTIADTTYIGLYADRGYGDSIIFYDGNCGACEMFKQSKDGSYLATYVLDGKVSGLEADFSSPVSWRGFTMEGDFYDNNTQVTYHFGADNNMVKELPSGETMSYVYFVNTEGLVTLSCLDGYINNDNMWLDTTTGRMYRMVYERDGWTDYMYGMTQLSSTSTDSADVSGTFSETYTLRTDGVQDANIVMERSQELTALLCQPSMIFGEVYSTLSESDMRTQDSNFREIANQEERLKEDLEAWEAFEEQKRKEKEDFLAQMADLAEQRAEAEEEERLQKELAAAGLGDTQYDYDHPYTENYPANWQPTIGNSYISGNYGDDIVVPGTTSTGPAGTIQSNFGDGGSGTGSSSVVIPSTEAPSKVPVIAPGEDLEDPVKDEEEQDKSSSETLPPTEANTEDAASEMPDWLRPTPTTNSNTVSVRFFCNCVTCHTSSSPVSEGATNVGLVNINYHTPGNNIVIGDPELITVLAQDATGQVTDSSIDVYIADHDWVQAQADGAYPIR